MIFSDFSLELDHIFILFPNSCVLSADVKRQIRLASIRTALITAAIEAKCFIINSCISSL